MESFKSEITDDGSQTLLHPILKDSYHSKQGAVREAMHVYVEGALGKVEDGSEVAILEMGLGTALNALLTLLRGSQRGLKIRYHAVELYPLESNVTEHLEYPEKIASILSLSDNERQLLEDSFLAIHSAPWNQEAEINSCFTITKMLGDICAVELPEQIDVVYWDAFAYETQPQLWSSEIFGKIFGVMTPGGILTTYSAKGEVKRALREAGFEVKRERGFGTKHHMIVAKKFIKL